MKLDMTKLGFKLDKMLKIFKKTNLVHDGTWEFDEAVESSEH